MHIEAQRERLFALIAVVVFAAGAGPACAASDGIFGAWLRDDGAARVMVAPCGGAICATNVWIRNPQEQGEKVGDRLVFHIKPTSDEWTGSAYDPQRKLSLSARLKALGDRMTTSGCVLGGLFCRTTKWTRM